MSTEAGRPRNPHVPLPPLAPPRPATPPRPTTPPRPGTPPRPRREPAGDEAADGAAPIPEDEPTARVAPRAARSPEPRCAPAGPSGSPSGQADGGRPAAPPRPAHRPAARTPAASSEPARPAAAAPPGPPPAHPPRTPGALLPDDDVSGPPTFQLRPIRVDEPSRPPLRTVAAAACLILGFGLLGGTAAGTLLTGDAEAGASPAQVAFDEARGLWHSVPVDDLFPRTVDGHGAGPGGADRRWTRVAVAPDGRCRNAFDPLLAKALSPVGCHRLIRATYADETGTSVITVGMVFTEADRAGMRDLRDRFTEEDLGERADLMPRGYAPRGTVAADFGDAQRAGWTIHVLTEAPVIVYAVSGFADGRAVGEPQPAAEATDPKATSAPAQAGLGHDAQGLADRIERALRGELPEPAREED